MSFALSARLAVAGNQPAPGVTIAFRAAASKAANTTSTTLTLPVTVQQGDVMIMVIGWSIASGQTLTTPTGWTQIGSQVSDEGQVASSAFSRVAGSSDAGTNVTITISASGNIAAVVSAYVNVDNATPIDASASLAEGATNVTTHVTPTVTTTVATDWLVSAVVDKGRTGATTTWTQPAGDTLRQTALNTGTTAVTAAISDTAATIATGIEGGKTWTSDASTSRATMWTFGLKASLTATGGGGGGGGGGTTSVMIGAASHDWSTLLTQSGNMQIARVYDAGFSTNAPSRTTGGKSVQNHWDDGRTVCYSFKPDPALLATQDATTMANLNTLLQSAVGKKMWWGIWHEPENNTIGTSNASAPLINLSDYVTAWQVFADTVHSYNEPGWKTIWTMMSFTWKKSFLDANPSFNPDSWYPGSSYVDVVGIDDYNEGSLHAFTTELDGSNNPYGDGTYQRWDSPGAGWGEPVTNESTGPAGGGYYSPYLLNWLDVKGKNYAICEWGSIRNLQAGLQGANSTPAMGRNKSTTTDPSKGPYSLDWWTATYGGDNSKASWIADYAKFHCVTIPASAHSTRCMALMYFDTGGRTWAYKDQESWELNHTPANADYLAYGQVLTDYGS